MWSIVRYKEEPMTIRDDNLTTALRAMIREEILSELDVRKLNEQNVIDEEGQFTEPQIESIKDIVKDMMGGKIEFTIEVHT